MDERTLLRTWQARARRSSSAHYQLAALYGWINTVLTIVVIVLTTFVGSSVFATRQDHGAWQWVLGGMSVLAAIVAGVQRAMHLSELAERHREAGAGWDKLFNEITLARAEHAPPERVLERVTREMAALVDKSPYIPQHRFEKAQLAETYDELLGES